MSRLTRRLFAAACTVLMLLSLCSCGINLNLGKIFNGEAGEAETVDGGETLPPPVGALAWASGEGITVVSNSEDLDEQVNKMYEAAADEGVAVEYKNEAFSTDGVSFACYIGNPAKSAFPMFITIYADTTFQEELFVSGLIKPGQAFNKVVMSRELAEGTYVMPVCYTQVYEPHSGDNDTDDFVIRAQTVLTINFNVVDPSVEWSLDD